MYNIYEDYNEDFENRQVAPNKSQWAQEIIHEMCVLDEIILKLQSEKSEVVDMYGTISIAARNYDKIVKCLKEKKQELKARLTYLAEKE